MTSNLNKHQELGELVLIRRTRPLKIAISLLRSGLRLMHGLSLVSPSRRPPSLARGIHSIISLANQLSSRSPLEALPLASLPRYSLTPPPVHPPRPNLITRQLLHTHWIICNFARLVADPSHTGSNAHYVNERPYRAAAVFAGDRAPNGSIIRGPIAPPRRDLWRRRRYQRSRQFARFIGDIRDG